MKLATLNDQMMCSSVVRYCLGRKSYIVPSCHEWIKDTWDEFTEKTRAVMTRDIIEYIMDNDDKQWNNIVRWCWARLLDKDKKWLRENLAYKKKPFPIK